MILNVSGRTDIVAFYMPWLMNRIREGYFDVRNPFNRKLVSRIFMEDVDAIIFCTKNPRPLVEHLDEIQLPIVVQVTLTSYTSDIEPNVPDKKKTIEYIKKISERIGKENVMVRYDPILLNEKYDIDYHIRAFDKLCEKLESKVETIIVSFLDEYQNVKRNAGTLKHRKFEDADYEKIGLSFSVSAKRHGLVVQTCHEKNDLSQFGFAKSACVSHELAYKLTGKPFKDWKARKCGCVEMVDIGAYNTCSHFCKYCYANYDEAKVVSNRTLHDEFSSMLIGHIEDGDVIKRRTK